MMCQKAHFILRLFLTLEEQPEGNQLGDDAAESREQRHGRRQFDGLHQAHCAHPEHVP